MIEAHDLHRTYRRQGQTVRALDGVSLHIGRGEMVAITGPSGSGKSTLMNVLGLLDRPDAGTYAFDGVATSSLAPDQLATLRNQCIGFVFQAFHLLPRATALENVELPLVYSVRGGRRGQGMRALERVGLADRASHRPGELSGGQQQRVAIARALVQEPDLILADEPTGNLDAAAADEVLTLFRTLHAQGATVVVITHDEAVARRAERRVEMVDGRLRGTPRPVERGSAEPPSHSRGAPHAVPLRSN